MNSTIEVFQRLSESVRRLDPDQPIGAQTLEEMRRLRALETRLLAQQRDAENAEDASTRRFRELSEEYARLYAITLELRQRLRPALKINALFLKANSGGAPWRFDLPVTLEGAATIAEVQTRLNRLRDQSQAWGAFEDWQALSPGQKSVQLMTDLFARVAKLEAHVFQSNNAGQPTQ